MNTKEKSRIRLLPLVLAVILLAVIIIILLQKNTNNNGSINGPDSASTDSSLDSAGASSSSEVYYVTAAEVKERYSEELKKVPEEYVELYLQEYPLTEEELERTDRWGEKIREDYEEGIRYDSFIPDIVNQEESQMDTEVFLQDLSRIVIGVDIMGDPCYYNRTVIDLQAGIIYYGALSKNYSDCRDSEPILWFKKKKITAEIQKVIEYVESTSSEETRNVVICEFILENKNGTIKRYSYKGNSVHDDNVVISFLENTAKCLEYH